MKKTLAINTPVTVCFWDGRTITRPVTIIKTGEKESNGYVGTARFFWNSVNVLPVVFINNKKYVNDRVCKQVKEFLFTWKTQLKKQVATNLCYTEHESRTMAREIACERDINYISGHPLWLTNSKMPVKCYSHETGEFLYERRAIIPAHMKEVVEKYVVSYCTKCIYRCGCEKPCLDPVTSSSEEVFA